jgi:aminopeptidase N
MKVFNASGYKHYDGVHWYPRISVYDHKFGWDTQQHLGKEFYGDFGQYDVELTFSSNYVVEATGELQNQNEVFPGDLRQRLDIANFANKPWESKASEITPYNKAERKTWKYKAINVHDFAFTADPTYRIGEVEWNGIKMIAVVQEGHASRWQNAAAYTAKVVETYSRDFGMYLYPKMVVADARDGMEYPMLTLDGGADPDYRGLFAHEIGHNWFFGMVGNNETYRAMMDEGFTQFLTSWALEHLDGDTLPASSPKGFYLKRFKKRDLTRESRVYNAYMNDAIRGNDTPLNVHSDDFNGALGHGGGYRNVYYKTASMLYNLQYVLGDELFLAAMKNYFNQWKICHPYPEDFRESIIRYTKVDLNWFFDQWIETTKTIDYKIVCVKNKGKKKQTLRIERKGEMQMPLDLTIVCKNDSTYNFHIPNTEFVKKHSGQTLGKWLGWGKLKPTYTAELNLGSKIKSVQIDTSGRLADTDLRNNQWPRKTSFAFDSRVINAPNRFQYEWFGRPEVWWNAYDGLKAGIHLNGNYMNHKNIFEGTFWFNFGLVQNVDSALVPINGYDAFSFNIQYDTPIKAGGKDVRLKTKIRNLDGLQLYQLGIERLLPSQKTKWYAYVKSMYRKNANDLQYLLYQNQWMADRWNNTLNVGLEHNYAYRRGTGKINLNLRTAAPYSDYSYSQITFTVVNKNRLGKFDFNSRTFLQLGFGSNTPLESALYAAGANPEELMENKYTRSIGFIPGEWAGYGNMFNHFHHSGGMNLRGYSGYLMPVYNQYDLQENAFTVPSGAAVNLELAFDRLLNIRKPKIHETFDFDSYLFTDAGLMGIGNLKQYQNNDWMGNLLRVDAGFGASLSIKKWGGIQKVSPLTIRADFPVFVNATPFLEATNFAFRWLIGVSKTF